MAFIADAAFDAALDYLRTNGTALSICDEEPASYAAIAAAELGKKTGITLTANADSSPSGRQATVGTFADGAVTADGTASHWALHNNSDTLVATGALSATQVVANGNTFAITSALILALRDAAAI